MDETDFSAGETNDAKLAKTIYELRLLTLEQHSSSHENRIRNVEVRTAVFTEQLQDVTRSVEKVDKKVDGVNTKMDRQVWWFLTVIATTLLALFSKAVFHL